MAVTKKSQSQESSETLAPYVRRVLHEKGLTAADVETRSKRGGRKGISRGYVSLIKNGKALNPSLDKLQALAHGLGEPEEVAMRVAQRLPLPTLNKFDRSRYAMLFYRHVELREEHQHEIDRLLDVVENEIERREERRSA